jgi:hypothetical protein
LALVKFHHRENKEIENERKELTANGANFSSKAGSAELILLKQTRQVRSESKIQWNQMMKFSSRQVITKKSVSNMGIQDNATTLYLRVKNVKGKSGIFMTRWRRKTKRRALSLIPTLCYYYLIPMP